MNDSLQSVLARHDGIASGSPLPNHKKNVSVQQSELLDSNAKSTEGIEKTSAENNKSPASDAPLLKTPEEEEEEDEFALLARRLIFLYNILSVACCISFRLSPVMFQQVSAAPLCLCLCTFEAI